MQRTLLKNGIVYTPDGVLDKGWLVIESGVITHIGQDTHPECSHVIDLKEAIVLPGFIDLHVHGARGYGTMQATPEALHIMAQTFAEYGVTGFLAATLTEEPLKTQQAIENIARCMGSYNDGATLLGCYIEGPYISTHAKGAHDDQLIRPAHPQEYTPWFETGAVKIMVTAPETESNMQLIKDCLIYKVTASLGHTTASYEQIKEAVGYGARHATHTFNAMGALHHRIPGTLGAVLTNDAITCELIADMVHLHPAVLKLSVRAKGVNNIVLVTDAEIGVGLPQGCYDFGDKKFKVTESAVYLPNGTLAGSILTMNKALRNIIHATGLSLEQAWPMTSYNAARQIGLEHKKGQLSVGYDADIVAIDPITYDSLMTFCAGTLVYSRKASASHE